MSNILAEMSTINTKQFSFNESPRHGSPNKTLCEYHQAKESKKTIYCCCGFYRHRQAFDSIWHNGLIYKLQVMGWLLFLIKLIVSTLRSFTVCVNDLPHQGSVISPHLYAAFTSDLKIHRNYDVACSADYTFITSVAQRWSSVTLYSALSLIGSYF